MLCAKNIQKKNPGFPQGFSYTHIDKPNSVTAPTSGAMDDHLSGSAITRTLERHPALARSTALHPGKDLAVSPLALLRELTQPHFYIFAVEFLRQKISSNFLILKFFATIQKWGWVLLSFVRSVSARTSEITFDGRYPLPCSERHC